MGKWERRDGVEELERGIGLSGWFEELQEIWDMGIREGVGIMEMGR